MLKNHVSSVLMLLLAAMFLTSSGTFAAGSMGKGRYTAETFYLKLDDTIVGQIKGLSGGGQIAEVKEIKTASDTYIHKNIASAGYEPLTIKMFLPSMDNSLLDWMASTWEGKFQAKNGSILSCDATHNVVREQQFTNGILTATTFPKLDAFAKEAGYITLVITPETIIEAVPSDAKITGIANSKIKTWSSSNYRLEIDGIDCTRIRSIESFTVNVEVEKKKVGDAAQRINLVPTRLKIPDLSFDISESASDTWRQWADDMITKGTNTKKNGRIILLDQTLKNEVGRIEFQGLGIFHLTTSSLESNADKTISIKTELFCEQMKYIHTGGPATPSTMINTGFSDAKLGQTYTLDNDSPLKLTMTKLDYTTAGIAMGNTYYVPQANEKLLVQYFTLENPNAAPRHVRFDSVRMTALHDAGENFNSNGTWGIVQNKSILDTNLQPGQKMDAYAVIEVPAVGAIKQLKVDPFDGSASLIYKLRDDKGQPVTYNPVTALTDPIADPADKTGATALLEVPGKLGTSYPYKNFDITVEKSEFTTEALDRAAPAAGDRFQVFTLLVKNDNPTGTRIRFDTITSKLTTALGEEMESGKALLYATNNRAVDITIRPGADMRVRIYFLIPKDIAPKTLTLKEDSSRSYTFAVGELKTIGGGRKME
ncbi:MAG: phage tail protein [bacterium]